MVRGPLPSIPDAQIEVLQLVIVVVGVVVDAVGAEPVDPCGGDVVVEDELLGGRVVGGGDFEELARASATFSTLGSLPQRWTSTTCSARGIEARSAGRVSVAVAPGQLVAGSEFDANVFGPGRTIDE